MHDETACGEIGDTSYWGTCIRGAMVWKNPEFEFLEMAGNPVGIVNVRTSE